jgi:hypothetical protein
MLLLQELLSWNVISVDTCAVRECAVSSGMGLRETLLLLVTRMHVAGLRAEVVA